MALYKKFAASARGKPSYSFTELQPNTKLDDILEDLAAKNSGLGINVNGLALIKENNEAFAARVISAKMAGRSLDLMYYIFDDDKVGKLLLYELLQAANRGVRVRLLIDDINVGRRDPIFRALDKHPNIEIRIFNPCRARIFNFKKVLEFILRAFSLTRRMHNKAYIVDGRVAFVGGRNIADSYFGASYASNVRDLDVLLTGPIVKDAENIFDLYWNSDVALPINQLVLPIKSHGLKYWEEHLTKYHDQAEMADFIKKIYAVPFEYFLRPNSYLFPVKRAKLLADPPQKALGLDNKNWLIHFLFRSMGRAKSELQITSPYFVPGDMGASFIKKLVTKGVKVKVLTNSLATTDVALAYGGYIHYRKDLLASGVKIYELMPYDQHVTGSASRPRYSRFHKIRLFAKNRASLHTKAFLIDEQKAFVGSFNFDLRSVSLNTEMGVYFECEKLAMHMNILFYEEICPEMSYELGLTKAQRIFWRFKDSNQLIHFTSEPCTTLKHQLWVKFISLLPIKSQL